MLCQYFRHIDLLQVFEQLDRFIWREDDIALANIPAVLSPVPAMYLEDIAETFLDDSLGRPWREMAPIDVAAEVGDVIEEHLEEIAQSAGIYIETGSEPSKVLSNLSELGLDVHSSERDYWRLRCLLIFQYDILCWLHSKSHFDMVLEVFEEIAVTRCAITEATSRVIQNEIKSREASVRASKRHVETNQERNKALLEWDKTGGNYSGMAIFSRLHCKTYGVTERTLYGWIRAHRKTLE